METGNRKFRVLEYSSTQILAAALDRDDAKGLQRDRRPRAGARIVGVNRLQCMSRCEAKLIEAFGT